MAESSGGEPSTGHGFGSPPPARTLKYDWSKIAAKCRRKPGEWYLIFRQDKATYHSALLQGSIAALRKDAGFEVRSANGTKNEDNLRICDLWVRYVPDNDTTNESETK